MKQLTKKPKTGTLEWTPIAKHDRAIQDAILDKIDKELARRVVDANQRSESMFSAGYVYSASGDQHEGLCLASMRDYIRNECRTANLPAEPAPVEKWDNRLIWSLEDLLAWVRKNHPGQMDIRDHIDLMLGKYRDELEIRQEQEITVSTVLGYEAGHKVGLEDGAKQEREKIYKWLEDSCTEYHYTPVVHFSRIEDLFKEIKGRE